MIIVLSVYWQSSLQYCCNWYQGIWSKYFWYLNLSSCLSIHEGFLRRFQNTEIPQHYFKATSPSPAHVWPLSMDYSVMSWVTNPWLCSWGCLISTTSPESMLAMCASANQGYVEFLFLLFSFSFQVVSTLCFSRRHKNYHKQGFKLSRHLLKNIQHAKTVAVCHLAAVTSHVAVTHLI